MSRHIHRYELSTGSPQTQAINMPKRARIIHTAISSTRRGLVLCAIVEEDNDTRAFDRGVHQRHFVVVEDGREIPEPGGYVGSVQVSSTSSCLHVFEVPR
jgi:hypothetical protein